MRIPLILPSFLPAFLQVGHLGPSGHQELQSSSQPARRALKSRKMSQSRSGQETAALRSLPLSNQQNTSLPLLCRLASDPSGLSRKGVRVFARWKKNDHMEKIEMQSMEQCEEMAEQWSNKVFPKISAAPKYICLKGK